MSRRRAPSRADANLRTYRKKRDFAQTPEPRGGAAPAENGFGYLVQKHAARRLHYDLRLELDGVLLSWAVPKGPSLDPKDRRLAVRTEDHPLEYGAFEGVIPKGEYGGGTVMLWDRGQWDPEGDPREALEKGHLVFNLQGERLRGRWHLVRSGKDGERGWLLFKGKDREARGDGAATVAGDSSVASGRSMEEIAEDRDRTWRSDRPPESAEEKAPRLRDLVKQIPTGVSFTNLDKVLYPEQGLSKAALVAYYAIVAPLMMPHVADRPLTLVRCPDGAPRRGTPRQTPKPKLVASRTCFYQKHGRSGVGEEIVRVPIREEDGAEKTYMAITDRDGLFATVQLGALELHTWGCHTDEVERPDAAVIDLDPDPNLPWDAVVEAALDVRELLEDLGLACWVKTTGGKGLHVCFPCVRRIGWDEFKEFTRGIARTLEAEAPDKYTSNMSKARRSGKVFIDYLRNGRGATAIAPYSTRARASATVATPLTWDELEAGARPENFDVRSMPLRIDSLKTDPWAEFLTTRQTITVSMQRRLAG